jgi:hypothetical protein
MNPTPSFRVAPAVSVRRTGRLFTTGVLATTLCALLPAQPAGPAATAAAASAPDVTTLSPFVVATDRDVGFVAAGALAGGRLGGSCATPPWPTRC